MRRVLAYRHGDLGTIWYGDVQVTLADMPVEGIDVSERVHGKLPPLPVIPSADGGRVQRPLRFTYTDDSQPTWMDPRVRVQVTDLAP